MANLFIIAANEIRQFHRDSRLLLIGGALTLLSLLGVLTSARASEQHRQEQSIIQNALRAQWLGQGSKNPHSAAHFGTYAIRPETPLSSLDTGVTPFTGSYVFLEAHKQNDFQFRPAQDQSAAARFGDLSFAVILQELLPLLIFLLVYSSVAEEKQNGTLRLMLSLGVPRRVILGEKALGIAIALTLTMLPALLATVSLVVWRSGATVDAIVRLSLSAIAYMVYMLALMGIGLAISASVREARTALVVLLCWWLCGTFALPRLTAELAKSISHVPTRHVFTETLEEAIKKGVDGHDPESARIQALKQEVLMKHHVTRAEDLPFNFDAYSMKVSEAYGNRVFDQKFGSLWEGYQRQSNLQLLSSLLYPLAPIQLYSMAMSGTDFARQANFARQAEMYRRMFVSKMNDDMMWHSKSGDWEYKAGQRLWDSTPDFRFQPPGWLFDLSRQSLEVVILLLWASLAGLWAWHAAESLEVG